MSSAAPEPADLESKLAEYQSRYDDLPYAGAMTPHPEWGPYDHEVFAMVQKYVSEIRTFR